MIVIFLTADLSDIKESQNIALLHNQITACDSILEVRDPTMHCMWSQEKIMYNAYRVLDLRRPCQLSFSISKIHREFLLST